MANHKNQTILCVRCGAEMEETVLEYFDCYPPQLGHIIFKDIPAKKCPECGEVYFSVKVNQTIDKVITEKIKAPQKVAVPLYPMANYIQQVSGGV
ncbi:MAG: YgiT-type zinc finger protein [bacterium]|nr:YgiT-type zinc finger protein [bacterium]